MLRKSKPSASYKVLQMILELNRQGLNQFIDNCQIIVGMADKVRSGAFT